MALGRDSSSPNQGGKVSPHVILSFHKADITARYEHSCRWFPLVTFSAELIHTISGMACSTHQAAAKQQSRYGERNDSVYAKYANMQADAAGVPVQHCRPNEVDRMC